MTHERHAADIHATSLKAQIRAHQISPLQPLLKNTHLAYLGRPLVPENRRPRASVHGPWSPPDTNPRSTKRTPGSQGTCGTLGPPEFSDVKMFTEKKYVQGEGEHEIKGGGERQDKEAARGPETNRDWDRSTTQGVPAWG